MKPSITRNTIVTVRLQNILFAFSLIMHIAATSVEAEHPLLAWLLATLEIVGWLSLLMLWTRVCIKGMQSKGPKLWRKIRSYTPVRVQRKKPEHDALAVPVAQLTQLRNNIQRLGLALHDLTPDMEQARRTHFEMLGEAVPDPILPPQNATLYAEFTSLIQFLNHCGFPHLERVRLQQKDVMFAQQWGRDLEARLRQAQRTYAHQQQTLERMLHEAYQQLEALNTTYPQAQDDAGYQRLQGALRLLKKIAHTSHRAEEVIGYLAALLEDIERLRTHLRQEAA